MKNNYTYKSLLTLIFNCFGFLMLSATQFTVGGIDYSIIGNTSNVEIVAKSTGYYSGNYTIPSEVEYNSKKYQVTKIADFAFSESIGLFSVSLSNGLKTIGTSAFDSCKNLSSINIPDSVESIGNYAFYNTAIRSITIPRLVSIINNYTFYKCKNLASITLNEGLITIGNSAFYDCSSLNPLSIPNSVTTIGNSAFFNCSALKEIIIPKLVSSIGKWAFRGCSNTTTLTSLATTLATLGESVFISSSEYTSNWQPKCDLFVPEESLELYRNADQWKDFKSVQAISTLSTNNTKLDPINIYPNPAKDLASINNLKIGAVISIYNAAGNLVYSTTAKSSKATINTSKFANGLHFVSIDGKSSTKLLIAK